MDPKYIDNLFKVDRGTYEKSENKLRSEKETKIDNMIDNFVYNNSKHLNELLNDGDFEENIEDTFINQSFICFEIALNKECKCSNSENDFFRNKVEKLKQKLFYAACENGYRENYFDYSFEDNYTHYSGYHEIIEVDFTKGYELAFQNGKLGSLDYLLKNHRSKIDFDLIKAKYYK